MPRVPPGSRRIRTTISRLRGGGPLREGELPDALRWGAAPWPPERAGLPLCLEIGFGTGESLLQATRLHPGWNFLGAEVLAAGIRRVAQEARREGLANLRLHFGDARDLLELELAPGSVRALQLFFPDPWPKRRHRKRRLLTAGFLDAAARALAPEGMLHLATDWDDYAAQMEALLRAHPAFRLVQAPDPRAGSAPGRNPSAFAARAVREGRSARDLHAILDPSGG